MAETDTQIEMAVAMEMMAHLVENLCELLVKKNVISEEENQRIRDTAIEDFEKAFQEV